MCVCVRACEYYSLFFPQDKHTKILCMHACAHACVCVFVLIYMYFYSEVQAYVHMHVFVSLYCTV